MKQSPRYKGIFSRNYKKGRSCFVVSSWVFLVFCLFFVVVFLLFVICLGFFVFAFLVLLLFLLFLFVCCFLLLLLFFCCCFFCFLLLFFFGGGGVEGVQSGPIMNVKFIALASWQKTCLKGLRPYNAQHSLLSYID